MSEKLEPGDIYQCLLEIVSEFDGIEVVSTPEAYSDTTVCASLRQTVVLEETSASTLAGDLAIVDRIFRRAAVKFGCQVQSSVFSGIMEAGGLAYFTWRSVFVRSLVSVKDGAHDTSI